jgi:trehalose synthase
MAHLNDYAPIVGARDIDELRRLAAPLRARRVQMINSTANGGGVAEILQGLVPLFGELGLDARWDVMRGTEDFFRVTKLIYCALHGDDRASPTARDLDLWLETNRANEDLPSDDADFVVVHDPQPLPLVRARRARSHWIWRCHLDISHPRRALWERLAPLVARYDAAVYSSDAFLQPLPIDQHVFFPPIDPLSDKNRELPPEVIDAVFERLGVPRDKPVVTQVSRFDRFKDPLGVVRAFEQARREVDCRLVLCGGCADDDPDGMQVLHEVLQAVRGNPDIHVLGGPQRPDVEVNALVRGSTIVLQKSLREGFGLTVAEALWKRKPVIASAVGGLTLQVRHERTGVLVSSVSGAAAQIVALLRDPPRMRELGDAGHEHVRRRFLVTHTLRRWLWLFAELARQGDLACASRKSLPSCFRFPPAATAAPSASFTTSPKR